MANDTFNAINDQIANATKAYPAASAAYRDDINAGYETSRGANQGALDSLKATNYDPAIGGLSFAGTMMKPGSGSGGFLGSLGNGFASMAQNKLNQQNFNLDKIDKLKTIGDAIGNLQSNRGQNLLNNARTDITMPSTAATAMTGIAQSQLAAKQAQDAINFQPPPLAGANPSSAYQTMVTDAMQNPQKYNNAAGQNALKVSKEGYDAYVESIKNNTMYGSPILGGGSSQLGQPIPNAVTPQPQSGNDVSQQAAPATGAPQQPQQQAGPVDPWNSAPLSQDQVDKLNNMPPMIRNSVMSLRNGENPDDITTRTGINRMLLIPAVSSVFPDYTENSFTAMKNMTGDAQRGKAAALIQATGAGTNHSLQAWRSGAQMPNRTSSNRGNEIINAGQSIFTFPQRAAAEQNAILANNEGLKIATGDSGAVGERAEGASNFGVDDTPEQREFKQQAKASQLNSGVETAADRFITTYGTAKRAQQSGIPLQQMLAQRIATSREIGVPTDKLEKQYATATGSTYDKDIAGNIQSGRVDPLAVVDWSSQPINSTTRGARTSAYAKAQKGDYNGAIGDLTKAGYKMLGQNNNKPVVVSSDDDWAKLPAGTLYVGPDGKTRRK